MIKDSLRVLSRNAMVPSARWQRYCILAMPTNVPTSAVPKYFGLTF